MAGSGMCPGSNTQFWGPEDVFEASCSGCGKTLEFFKDDSKRVCPDCKRVTFNPRSDFSCAQWCPAAESCLGPERYKQMKETEKRELRRKEDMERLLATLSSDDAAVKQLFMKLYQENKNPAQLFDPRKIQELEYQEPELYKKAITAFQQFQQQEKG